VRKLARSLHHRHLATRWSAKSNRFRRIPCPRFDANTHSDNIDVTVCDTRTGRCISLLTTSGDALFFVFLRIRIISPYAVQSWMPLEIRHSLWHRLKVTQATVHGVLAYSRSVRDDDRESGDKQLFRDRRTDLESLCQNEGGYYNYNYNYTRLSAIELFLPRFVAENHHAGVGS